VFTKEKSSTPTGLVWDTNMAALLFFLDTKMADMTLCEKAPLLLSKAIYFYALLAHFNSTQLTWVATSGRGPSSNSRRANEAAVLKFLSYKI